MGAGFLFACGGELESKPPTEAGAPSPSTVQPVAEASYVGSQQCAECHEGQGKAWTDSHHDLAMQEPNAESVLGHFDGREIVLDGQTWEFMARESRDPFRVRVPESDGEPRIREIAYTFGAMPLQQYLVRSAGGRLQPLPVAWDSRDEAQGGQRWFHLYEGQSIPSTDSLHWNGRLQTWNHQCASCHSTHLEKRYDEVTDEYDTRWAEIDVGCEGCHGKGSSHVRWARAGATGTENGLRVLLGKSASQWSFADGQTIAKRSAGAEPANELDTCAPCHARRSPLTTSNEPPQSFLDAYQPALLDEGLYFDDGQIRDEVYVWGSFAQSAMHDAGVTCSDCHDPHSLEVRGGPDAVCSSCHAPIRFASTDHHGHPENSDGASCVACHMPSHVYMGVDARRDHSMRVPRPDISQQLGAPDACTSCHNDRDPEWAAASLEARGALRKTAHPGVAIHNARTAAPGAQSQLAEVVTNSNIAALTRATAASLLDAARDPAAASALRNAAQDSQALVRIGALRALARITPAARVAVAEPLLRDPVRSVRTEAARVLAPAPPNAWPPGTRVALADAVADYRKSQLANSDRFEAQLNLSTLEAQLGNPAEAIRRAERALEFEPAAVAARVNLADLLRASGREEDSDHVLRSGLEAAPNSADLRFALGLSLVRQGATERAIGELALAAELAPQTPRFAYTHGIALHSTGRSTEAVEALTAATKASPAAARDLDLLFALATIERDRGNYEAAIDWAEQLAAANPGDPRPATLLRQIQKR